MRPHRLEITAFGPFAETAVVDFDELAAAGLVLLHGDTGAGKTSVLDALGYALYGEVPGVRGVIEVSQFGFATGESAWCDRQLLWRQGRAWC